MRQLTARWIALLTITAIAVYLCWLIIQPFVQVLLWAMVLAIVSHPLHIRLSRRVRNRDLCAVLTTLIVVLTALTPLVLIAIKLVDEAATAAPKLQAGARELLSPDSPYIHWLRERTGIGPLFDPEFLAERIKALSTAVASRALGTIGSILGVVIQGIFVLLTVYYLLRDADKVVATLKGFIPIDQEQSSQILQRTNEIIFASLYGVLMIAGLQAILGGLAFWVSGVPSPMLWSVMMFFLSMIPMAGSFIVWVPATIWLLATGHWIKALLLALWCALVIGMMDNLLRPKLVGQRTRLHELVVFFSVLGGLQVFGVLGLVVGPVVIAIALALVDVFRQAGGWDTSRKPPSVPGVGDKQVAVTTESEKTDATTIRQSAAAPP